MTPRAYYSRVFTTLAARSHDEAVRLDFPSSAAACCCCCCCCTSAQHTARASRLLQPSPPPTYPEVLVSRRVCLIPFLFWLLSNGRPVTFQFKRVLTSVVGIHKENSDTGPGKKKKIKLWRGKKVEKL